MKKLICLIAVLALAAPLCAGEYVNFKATNNNDGSFTISYAVQDTVGDGNDVLDGTNPVGIGLKVEIISGSADIMSASNASANFELYPDYYYSLDDAARLLYAIGDGHPIADPAGNPGAIDLGVGVSAASICMARVEDGVAGPNPGPQSDSLITLQLQGPDWATVKIDLDDDRGGVVGSQLMTNLPITIPIQACWGYPCFPFGDANGNGIVEPAEIVILKTAWDSGVYDIKADFSRNGSIDPADIVGLKNGWDNGCP